MDNGNISDRSNFTVSKQFKNEHTSRFKHIQVDQQSNNLTYAFIRIRMFDIKEWKMRSMLKIHA